MINENVEKLIMLQMGKCKAAYEIITENMDIESLNPSDKHIIEELKTVKTLHELCDCLTKVREPQ